MLGAALLALAPPAGARLRPITGSLDRKGLTVVAVAPHGKVTSARARPGFSLVPPARAVTLQLRDRAGRYVGPVVVRGHGRRVVMGVRPGARLGRIDVRGGYGRVARAPRPGRIDESVFALARRGVPLGAGNLGWVRARPAKAAGDPGTDVDRDGIPAKFDVDDDGDLVPDVRESSGPAASRDARLVATAAPLAACPAAVCAGQIEVHPSDVDRVDVALAVAIAAAVLALASLLLQLLGLRRRHRRRVTVDVRLGLPIYQQSGGDWSVFVEVVNGSEHPVRWISAALELTDGRRLYLMQQPPGGELPAVLQPHDSRETWTPCQELERAGLDLSERVVGIAKLDTGEILRSKPHRLLSRSAGRRRGPRR